MLKDIVIGVSKLEDRPIIRHQELISVGMALSPFIKDYFLHKNVAFKDGLDWNFLMDQLSKVILEQI